MSEQFSSDPEIQKWLDGQFLLLKKPLGWTSFDLVRKVRYSICKYCGIKKIKVGHAGTLDPLASGLMILCTGKATKKLFTFQDLGKEYVAGFRFGATTPSFDLETEIDKTFPVDHITLDKIKEVAAGFVGPQMQIPPIFSAKRIEGKRAYNYARDGETAEMQKQAIEIKSIEVIDFLLPDVKLRVSCSKGTYIRALARDMGLALGSGGHLYSLSRTKIGSYSLDNAQSVEDFEKSLQLV